MIDTTSSWGIKHNKFQISVDDEITKQMTAFEIFNPAYLTSFKEIRTYVYLSLLGTDRSREFRPR
jgi:hypothetical protein